jgi:hypothetical protein
VTNPCTTTVLVPETDCADLAFSKTRRKRDKDRRASVASTPALFARGALQRRTICGLHSHARPAQGELRVPGPALRLRLLLPDWPAGIEFIDQNGGGPGVPLKSKIPKKVGRVTIYQFTSFLFPDLCKS